MGMFDDIPATAGGGMFDDIPSQPKTGTLESALEGYLGGASANFRDEIYGASKASGLPDWAGGFRAPVGAARLAYEHLTGQPGTATDEYNRAVDEIRSRQKQMKSEHPFAYGAGELVGAGASMAAAPELGAAKFGRYGAAALKGAEYGAVAGAGDAEGGLGSRAIGAGAGAVEGAVAGPVGEAVGAGAGKVGGLAYDYFGRPIAGAIRGLINPEKEAVGRTAGAMARDYPQLASGDALGMTPTQWMAAKNAGEPVILGDMGAETTRAVMRSAANSSPEARNAINAVLQDRFETQSQRAGSTIRGLISGGANAAKSKAQLEAEYDLERGGAYTAAYNAGDRPVWSPELERLTSSPTVAGALRGAVNRWKDFQVKDGFGGMNPPVNVTPDGQLKFTGGQGMLPYPNLQLWDYTLRNLAGMASAAKRAGNTTDAGLYGGLAGQLKTALYKEVPEFENAQGIAAKYFGGNNAIEAGQNAINEKNVGQLKLAMAKMKPAEREMFTESYLDAYANKVEGMSDRTDVTGRIFNNPRERAKLTAIAGPQAADTMQAFLQREKIYDASRKALGNSTTVRQMIEAGLAGGAAGAGLETYLSGGDWRAAGIGALAGSTGTKLVRYGGQKMLGYVDQNVARRVAELLTSDDPRALAQGIMTAAKNQRVMQGLREIARRPWAAIGARGGENVPLPALPSPAISGAQEQNQQPIPRPPPQQKHGGKVESHNHFSHGGKVSQRQQRVREILARVG